MGPMESAPGAGRNAAEEERYLRAAREAFPRERDCVGR